MQQKINISLIPSFKTSEHATAINRQYNRLQITIINDFFIC